MAAGARSRATPCSLPGAGTGLQRLCGQASVHGLRPWPGGRSSARPLAALGGRALPSRDCAPARRPERAHRARRAGPSPSRRGTRAPRRDARCCRARRPVASPRPPRSPGGFPDSTPAWPMGMGRRHAAHAETLRRDSAGPRTRCAETFQRGVGNDPSPKTSPRNSSQRTKALDSSPAASDLFNELGRQHIFRLLFPARPDVYFSNLGLFISHYKEERNLLHGVLADLGIHLLVARVDLHAHADCLKL